MSACIFLFKKRDPTTIATGEGLVVPKAWLATNKDPRTHKADVRAADQTFLTFPEWFLVFSRKNKRIILNTIPQHPFHS
jgi:hypothetical protein